MPTHTQPLRRVLALAALAVVSLTAARADAYNGSEHIRFPDQAYQVLNIMRRGAYFAETANRLNTSTGVTFAPLTTAPPGADAARWLTFRSKALAAPGVLDNVLVRLKDPTLPSTDCAGAFPTFTQDQHMFACRAGDLSFAPRRYWASNRNECFLRGGYQPGGSDQNTTPAGADIPPFFKGLPTNYTGAALGLWATAPDDEQDDLKVWLRPSNLVFISTLKSIAETLADGVLDIVFVPLVCFGELIFSGGSDNCFDDATTFTHAVDPVTVADEVVGVVELNTFGQKSFASNDWPMSTLGISLPGLWHFTNFASFGGQFYDPPGIQVSSGGPSTAFFTDAIDILTVAGADALGVTVHPIDSAGVDNYAFGDDNRMLGDWIDSGLGHVEFNPLYNLAQYGWNMFTTKVTPTSFGSDGTHGGGAGANGLGWVLHAVGDAMCPQHTIGSLGWGHQPWERYAGMAWEGPPGTGAFEEESLLKHYPDLQVAMKYAFDWWTYLDDHQKTNGGALPVSDFVTAVAKKTYLRPTTVEGSLIRSDASWDYKWADDKDAVVRANYGTHSVDLQDHMLEAIGASIAFMVKAADFVPATTSLPPSPCACTEKGKARSGQDFQGNQQIAPGGTCIPCGTGVFTNMPNWLDGRCVAVCPPDKPTVAGGACTATGACPPDQPFRKNGACVASCCTKDSTCASATPFREGGKCVAACATPLVANYRDCVAACPAGQVPDATNPFLCGPPPPTTSKTCDPKSDSVTTTCCRAQGAVCTTDADCCTHSCFAPDGLCQGGVGATCVTGSECISGNCQNGVCAVGTTGQRCLPETPSGCGSGLCPATGTCASGGAACTKDSDCGGPADCVFKCQGGHIGNKCLVNPDCLGNVCQNGSCLGGPQDACRVEADCGGAPATATCQSISNKCCLLSGRCSTGNDCCSGSCNGITCVANIP